MTDIVERLRAYRMDVDSPDVVYEAADEIERLRAAVDRTKELADCFECYDGSLSGQTVATAIRRNLEPYDPEGSAVR